MPLIRRGKTHAARCVRVVYSRRSGTGHTWNIAPIVGILAVMKNVTSAHAAAHLDRLLADIERTGDPVMITHHGRAIAKLVPVSRARTFGHLPNMLIPSDFDEPLPDLDRGPAPER